MVSEYGPRFCVNPFPKQQILDSSKPKVFADNNSKRDENGRKFSKWEENTVGKGEIACNEQFLLFPQCFQKTCTAEIRRTRLRIFKPFTSYANYGFPNLEANKDMMSKICTNGVHFSD